MERWRRTEWKGNREGISIEICYSKSGGSRFILAEKRAARLIADILDQKDWDMYKVTKHQDYSGKYCPHRTLDMGWNRFLKMIEAERKTIFKVRVTADSLNYRAGAGVQYKINGTKLKGEFIRLLARRMVGFTQVRSWVDKSQIYEESINKNPRGVFLIQANNIFTKLLVKGN